MPTVVIRNRNKVPIPCSSWSTTSIMAKPLSKAMSIDMDIRHLVVITHRTLHWRHNDHDGVWNHQPHGCLLKCLFRRRSKKTSKLRVTGLCVGNSPGPVNSPHKGPITRKMFPFDDVIMIRLSRGSDKPSAIYIKITRVSIVFSAVCSCADQRKYQISASLAFVRDFTGDRWIFLTKGQYRGKCFHLMTSSWAASSPRLLLRSQGFAFQVVYNLNTGFSF